MAFSNTLLIEFISLLFIQCSLYSSVFLIHYNSAFVSISKFSRENIARIFKQLKGCKEVLILKNNKPVGTLTYFNPNARSEK